MSLQHIWSVVLFLAAAVTSCGFQARLVLQESGAVAVDAKISLKPAALEAWKSLRDLDPSLPPEPLEAGLLRKSLGDQARITPAMDGTTASFTVDDPRRYFPGLKTTARSWDLALDRSAIGGLAALSTWSGSPALSALLPSPDAPVTEVEYRDLLVYLLGSGTTEQTARALIDGSTVQITVEAPRPLKSAPGSVSMSGNTAVYRWPLVRVLALETPLRLHVEF